MIGLLSFWVTGAIITFAIVAIVTSMGGMMELKLPHTTLKENFPKILLASLIWPWTLVSLLIRRNA